MSSTRRRGKMRKSESITEIAKAMAAFQKEVKQPFKDADNPFFKSKYVPLESVVEAIHDIAPKHGLSFTQWALNDENGQIGVATLLMHESGEFIEYDPVFMKAEKQTPQGAGALITYLKRYTLSAIFGITSDQDDDGNQASGNAIPKRKQPLKATLLAKYKLGGKTEKEFEEWYKKMKEQGRDHIWMDDVLTKALAERDNK